MHGEQFAQSERAHLEAMELIRVSEALILEVTELKAQSDGVGDRLNMLNNRLRELQDRLLDL